jgi:hydrogenase-4 component F
MITLLIFLPLFAGIVAMLTRGGLLCRILLVGAPFTNLALLFLAEPDSHHSAFGGWILLDHASLYFLIILNVLFFAVSVYVPGYLRLEREAGTVKHLEGDFIFAREPESFFTGFLLLFFASANLVLLSQHMGLLWVGMEATTVMCAPLIYFHRHHNSLEAAWKFMLICSVGLGLALLGTMFLAMSVDQKTYGEVPFLFNEFMAHSESLDPFWLHVSFIFIVVGYGTKMGLAPMHTWLPDAHSQAPSPISALLSGALLNCAFLGIMRMWQIMNAGGHADFADDILIAFGLFSMFIAAVFLLNQAEYKRMLAYSGVEHMGIMALGVGIGGNAIYGSLLHAANHSLIKSGLFLVSGNILRYFHTRQQKQVTGAMQIIPASSVLWVAGFLGITGTPPFGLFISKFIILREAIDQGHIWLAALFLFLLAVIFIAMMSSMLSMVQGTPPEHIKNPAREHWSLVIPAGALLFLGLALGIYQPEGLVQLLKTITQAMGGGI